jgi:hypothetical protein
MLLFELAHDHPGSVVGKIGVACEVGLRRAPEPTQRGQDHALVEQSQVDRVAALADRRVLHGRPPW